MTIVAIWNSEHRGYRHVEHPRDVEQRHCQPETPQFTTPCASVHDQRTLETCGTHLHEDMTWTSN